MFIHIPDQIVKAEARSILPTLFKKLDLVGFVFFAPAAIQFLLALEYGGNKYPWNSARIIGLFCGAGGTFLTFLAWEYRKGDEAMIPFSMVGKRSVWSSLIVGVCFIGTVMCFSYYLPIYFQAVKGVSPFMSGVYFLPNILSQLFLAITTGVLGNYYTPSPSR